MDLTLTEDQRLIQSTARELLDSRAAAAGARAVADDPAGCPAGYSARLWKEIVELGWTGLAFPEEYGGVGEGFLELCLVIEELGRARVPTPLVPTWMRAVSPGAMRINSKKLNHVVNSASGTAAPRIQSNP